MKTANVRDLRNNFASLETWVENGEQVEVLKRGKPVAWLIPVPRQKGKSFVKPNFAKRRKAIWGEKVFTSQEIKAMRAAELEGEQG